MRLLTCDLVDVIREIDMADTIDRVETLFPSGEIPVTVPDLMRLDAVVELGLVATLYLRGPRLLRYVERVAPSEVRLADARTQVQGILRDNGADNATRLGRARHASLQARALALVLEWPRDRPLTTSQLVDACIQANVVTSEYQMWATTVLRGLDAAAQVGGA